MKKNIPNLLTLLRGFLTLLMVPLFFIPWEFQYITVYILFIIASVTDFLDGYLARKWNVVSDFGKMFDPLFDKILTITLFVLFIPFDLLPVWIFVVFIIRDLWVDGIKNFMLSKGTVTPAMFWGKLKFFCLVFFFHCAFLSLIFLEFDFLKTGLWIFASVGLLAALISGFYYTQRFISFFLKQNG